MAPPHWAQVIMTVVLMVTPHLLEMAMCQSTAAIRRNVAMGPTVSIKDGKVRPMLMQSRFDRQYYGFLGIPYAAPQIGRASCRERV